MITLRVSHACVVLCSVLERSRFSMSLGKMSMNVAQGMAIRMAAAGTLGLDSRPSTSKTELYGQRTSALQVTFAEYRVDK